jgi:hypothetical protein
MRRTTKFRNIKQIRFGMPSEIKVSGVLILFKIFKGRGPENRERSAKRFPYQLNQAGSTSGPILRLLDVDYDSQYWLVMMIN